MSDDLGELLGPVAAALRLLGLQAPSTSWSLTWRALLLLVVNASVPAMAASKLWVAPAAKLEELAVEVFVCVTGVAMTVKVAAFLWQQERMQRLALLLADCRRRFVRSGGGPGDTRARYRRHIRRIVVYMQGEQLTASAFSGDWPEGDARMRKALLVLMLRSSRPLKLTVGKLYVLSRHTFLQILNGSYTLFNMLYQVQTKK
ncbi:uncharacterized protein LOC126186457 [Schistocerca cancellata]|uniref:uncharacterized protein LOC126186457 n=1 Tax=Schistocerca cancellata TaxID=274614 RepID=UPI0021196068|nr:uncharacterized protein LOC126186457 [Schistocerca cancellata]